MKHKFSGDWIRKQYDSNSLLRKLEILLLCWCLRCSGEDKAILLLSLAEDLCDRTSLTDRMSRSPLFSLLTDWKPKYLSEQCKLCWKHQSINLTFGTELRRRGSNGGPICFGGPVLSMLPILGIPRTPLSVDFKSDSFSERTSTSAWFTQLETH